MKTIVQKVTFETTPKELYEIFMDSKKHGEVTGGKAVVSRKVGGSFKAFGGELWGKNLALAPGRMIAQSWRSSSFKKGDWDSVLILTFEPKGKGTELTMTHAAVPDHDAQGVTDGWHQFYWEPIKKYLKRKGGNHQDTKGTKNSKDQKVLKA